MGVIAIVLYTIVVIVSVLLIGLVLIQQSKGGGLGGVLGGAGESVFGAHTGNHLTKLTVILSSIFLILVLTLAIITGHRDKPKSAAEASIISTETEAIVPNEKPTELVTEEVKSLKESSKESK